MSSSRTNEERLSFQLLLRRHCPDLTTLLLWSGRRAEGVRANTSLYFVGGLGVNRYANSWLTTS